MKKSLALSAFLFYSFPAMNEAKTLETSKVENLNFELIEQGLKNNWANWLVTFEYEGKRYWGYLDACADYPQMMHHDTIEDVTLDDE
jgi:hypothetical protein